MSNVPSARSVAAPARVLFIANSYPHWTGTDEAGLVLIRRMAERGHPVTVLQTWSDILEPHLEGLDGVTCVRRLSDDMNFAQMDREWIRVFRAHASDVCILNKGFYEMRRGWVDVAARLSSRRYVAVEHHPADPPELDRREGAPWYHPYYRHHRRKAAFALHYATLHEVVINSRAVRDRLRRWYGLPRHKGIVVPHGIDTDAYRFDEAGRRRMRATLGLADAVFVFGAVGRLAHEKGHDRLLPVFARLAADPAHDHLRLVLAGTGPEAERLKDDARRLGIAHRVLFPGWLADEDKIPFLSALDCFVVPSRLEGQGLALIQAMACERPCVATDCGGVADVLTDPAVGWLTPTDDFVAFERAMRDVLALPPSDRAAVGRRARAHAMQHFELVPQADRMIDALLGPFAARDGARR